LEQISKGIYGIDLQKIIVQQLGYIKQIDGIRAIAVMMVVIFHWFAGGMVTQSGIGSIGVDIFFSLSGFLITRILLVYRYNNENGTDPHGKWHLVARFMYRRALRIFPPYFLLLFVVFRLNHFLPNTLKVDWGWYVAYLQNFLFYIRQSWPIGKVSPFWTLAVEEQFYLFWPLVILFLPLKRLGWAIGLLFTIGFLCYHMMPLVLAKKSMVDVLTPTCLHAFAAGAAVAWFHLNKPNLLNKSSSFLYIGFALILFSILGRLFAFYMLIDHRSLVALGTSCIIVYVLNKPEGGFGKNVIGNPAMVAIGKISYGIYLYHNFIPSYLKGIRVWLVKRNPDFWLLNCFPDHVRSPIFFYMECFILLFLLSFCSFRFFEKPLMSLKNKIS